MRVGYLADSYPYERNIKGIIKDCDYIKVKDLYKLGSMITRKLKPRLTAQDMMNVDNSFNDLNINRVDFHHFFNTVSYGKTPWISTFETFIPRFNVLMVYDSVIPKQNKLLKKALSALASDSCKKLIAMSESTVNHQKVLLSQYPEFKSKIESKICVIHPPQQLYVDTFEEKGLDDKEISFIFVGRDFFRKGGFEILQSFNRLKNNYNLPVKLTIVSSLDYGDYATQSGIEENKFVARMINENNSWITHYNSLSNDEVLHLMKSHHVGLLPTWGDTYGYSVLEMQSAGCPVITTDVRALPEINDDEKGWIINIPKNRLGEAIYSDSEQRKALSDTITDQLEEIIKGIMTNRDVIVRKAQNSIEHIKKNHSPEKYAKTLETIYKECVSN